MTSSESRRRSTVRPRRGRRRELLGPGFRADEDGVGQGARAWRGAADEGDVMAIGAGAALLAPVLASALAPVLAPVLASFLPRRRAPRNRGR
ncbi:hypothetical protein AB0D78_04600 [Streptomyces avermitilis]|uniref:hypothetical protein n=1 Tax=Streptomyces avermitilis TaxID=33903 RepID=UPI0033FD74E3